MNETVRDQPWGTPWKSVWRTCLGWGCFCPCWRADVPSPSASLHRGTWRWLRPVRSTGSKTMRKRLFGGYHEKATGGPAGAGIASDRADLGMYRVRGRAAVCAAAAGRLRPGGHGRYGQCSRLSVARCEVRTVVYRGQGVIVYEYKQRLGPGGGVGFGHRRLDGRSVPASAVTGPFPRPYRGFSSHPAGDRWVCRRDVIVCGSKRVFPWPGVLPGRAANREAFAFA